MNFERILFANLAYRKCLGNIDAEDADKMKYDANDMTKARDTILDTLRHCYLDEFMGFLGGYHTYWVASDMELEILREQQERIEANMKMMGMGNSTEYFEVIKYLYYGYQMASWSSCEDNGIPNPMVRAEGGESYIREIAEVVDFTLENSYEEKSRINLENAKDYRMSNILKCLDCQAFSYNYNWLGSTGIMSIAGFWRLRKTMKNICSFHKLLLKEIERLSRYLELEKSPARAFSEQLGNKSIKDNYPTIETWAILPLKSRLRGISKTSY